MPQQFQLEINIAKNLSKLIRCIICAPLAQYIFCHPLVLKIQEYDPYAYYFADKKITKTTSIENEQCAKIRIYHILLKLRFFENSFPIIYVMKLLWLGINNLYEFNLNQNDL